VSDMCRSDIYAKKFPELEQLVPAPMDFVRVVKAIGNETVCIHLSCCLRLFSPCVLKP